MIIIIMVNHTTKNSVSQFSWNLADLILFIYSVFQVNEHFFFAILVFLLYKVKVEERDNWEEGGKLPGTL